MNRRHFILGSVAAAVGVTLLKPSDLGSPYSPYFAQLNKNLKSNGNYLPSLLVDLDQIDHNISLLPVMMNPTVDLRIVAKSLPSPKLLGYIMDKVKTAKLMLFHQPFLSQIAIDYPQSDILMGKPMPVVAAKAFYLNHPNENKFIPETQLQWLIDSHDRLLQYLSLAKELNTQIQINIELDVGLHRGGLQQTEDLDELLKTISKNPEHLRFSGFMGYDPHVVKIPSIVKSQEEAFEESQAIYQSFIDRLYDIEPSYRQQSLCFNGAGSPTIALHKNKTVANELSAGSCFVKPTDFDIPSLNNFNAAAYIATPVLKKMQGTSIPAVEFAKDIFPLWDPNMQQTFFMYGGKWMAKFESPAGLQGNGLFGTSTNQAIVNGSKNVNIDVDDYIFLRPSQSEFVFLQFGDLLAIRNQKILSRWPILKQS